MNDEPTADGKSWPALIHQGLKALVNQCRPRLPIGGRLVVHGVTMEAEMLVETLHCDLGGDLIRFGVETADVIGRLHGWKPARTVVAWTWQRTE